jgi:hypothetical protein
LTTDREQTSKDRIANDQKNVKRRKKWKLFKQTRINEADRQIEKKERIIKIYYSPKLLNDKQKKQLIVVKNRNLHKNNYHNSENFQEEDIEGFPLRMKFKESVKKLTFLSVWWQLNSCLFVLPLPFFISNI